MNPPSPPMEPVANPTPDASPYSSPRGGLEDRLRRARRLRIQGRRLVARAFAGDHRSVFQGTGIEFESVREYAWGDDVRAIDWNVTARAGRPFVKRFIESRERAVWIAIDRSGSMDFGSEARTKADVAAELAVWIASAAEATNDRVGLLLFTGEIDRTLQPRRSAGWVDRLVSEVVREGGVGTADLDGVALEISRVVRPRDVVFLVSDFHAVPASRRLAVLARRQELVCVRVTDPRELSIELEGGGIVTCVDPESGRCFTLDAGDERERRRFAQVAAERMRAGRAQLVAAGAELLDLSTRDDVLTQMMAFFARRVGRR